MPIQGWVSQRFLGSLFDLPARSEENKSCVSLLNSINMKWVLKLSLLSTLSPTYLTDTTFSKVPFKDDVKGRDKLLFVGNTNALTRLRMELHQPSLFPFLKGNDVVLKLDSVSGRCNLLVEYTVICGESSAWVSNWGWWIIDEYQEMQWSTVALPWGMRKVAKCYFNLAKSGTSDTIMFNMMLPINSWLPCRTLLRSQVEWGKYVLSPHYNSLGLYWCHKIFCRNHVDCCESVRMSCSERWPMLAQWTMCSHILQRMVVREIGRLFDSADLLPFLKYRDDQCIFQEKGIQSRSSEACKMRVTAGATSAISFINQEGTPSGHVVLWDLRLQSSLVT